MGGSVVHERMTDKPNTSQKLNPEDTGALLTGAGFSGIMKVRYGECGQGSKDRSSLTAHKRTHTGEKPIFVGSVGKASIGSPISSDTRGHTQERGPMFVGNVGIASIMGQISSHTRGHTQG